MQYSHTTIADKRQPLKVMESTSDLTNVKAGDYFRFEGSIHVAYGDAKVFKDGAGNLTVSIDAGRSHSQMPSGFELCSILEKICDGGILLEDVVNRTREFAAEPYHFGSIEITSVRFESQYTYRDGESYRTYTVRGVVQSGNTVSRLGAHSSSRDCAGKELELRHISERDLLDGDAFLRYVYPV